MLKSDQIAKQLVTLRECQNLRASEFAIKVGITRQFLCDVEAGRRSISLKRAVEWFMVLGMDGQEASKLYLQWELEDAHLPYRVLVIPNQ